MNQAKTMDQEPVLLLRNYADGVHRGYAGEVILLPAEIADRLVNAGAAEAVVEEKPAPAAKRTKGKG